MSSDSESEFFDAIDTTPSKLDRTPVPIKTKSEADHNSKDEKYKQFQQSARKNVPSVYKTETKPLSNKLASSMPTLYFGDSSVRPPEVDAQVMLQNLDEKFAKENAITEMLPPSAPVKRKTENSLSVDDQNKNNFESISACSGSLLSFLGHEECGEARSKPSGRRTRHKDRREAPLIDEEEPNQRPSSPCDSISSSVDALFPGRSVSAPFRVVEHDETSVYSSNYLVSDKLSKSAPEQELKVQVSEQAAAAEALYSSSTTLDATTPCSSDVITLSSEPDIVASTKSNSLPRVEMPLAPEPIVLAPEQPDAAPIVNQTNCLTKLTLPTAPPRRNKARKQDGDSVSSMPGRAMINKDFDVVSHILDMTSATQGDCVVNSQDFESSKGDGPSEEQPRQEATEKDDGAMAASESSDKALSDEEILSLINITNLDTGESMPLSEAEAILPPVLNPLSFHIEQLTNGLHSAQPIEEDSDEESVAGELMTKLSSQPDRKSKSRRLKNFLNKRMECAVSKAKNIAQEVSHKGREEKDIFEDDAPAQNTRQFVKIKTAHSHKGPLEFDNLMYAQELKGEHTGPVWCVRHSPCGRLLATAGQDHVLRVWVLKQAFNYFLDIRTKWNADVKTSPTPSQESLVSQVSSEEDMGPLDPKDDGLAPYMPKPFCIYSGHTADVLDLSWSKHYFILTSSMDKTARLWHISRKECLCIFKHVDFVTAIAFHPRDDRYFISGSLDGKLRLWSIPDKQVVLWNEVAGQPKLITAANFCQNGAYIVVGTYNGRCIFYKTAELKYYTEIHVKSSRGKNARGRKITGIEPLPDEDKLMITSNDSRIRIYDLNVLNVSCKYKGHSNVSSQIRAGFSHDGKYIVSGSENQCIYLWKTHHDYSKFSSARKDRNVYWEGVKAHSAVVTCAVFSPHPEHVFNFIEQQGNQNANTKDHDKPHSESSTHNKGYVLLSADFNGVIKIFLKKEKPKHSSLPASALA